MLVLNWLSSRQLIEANRDLITQAAAAPEPPLPDPSPADRAAVPRS
ncbi:hypothetical protein ACIQV3_19270 [Streptomyces sp. NPDC099050]